MTTSALDMRYGRQGGRVVPFRQRDPQTDCQACGRPVLDPTLDFHAECKPDPDQLAFPV